MRTTFKNSLVGIVAFAAMFCCARGALSQINAGRGLTHVLSGWNMDPGYLVLYGHTRFFGKVGNVNDPQNVNTAVTFWDVQGNLVLAYTISEHFEASVHSIVYQDNHKGGKGYNMLDDLFLSLRVASFGKRGSGLKYGANFALRIPTASYHNIIFEPYSANKASFGFKGLLSYSKDPLYPDDEMNLHLNLGYWYYNDVGEQLTDVPSTVDTVRVLSPSQAFQYGAAINLPTDKFDFGFELYGSVFIQKPPPTAYSRENWLYFSPRVRYKAYRWLDLDMALDLRLAGSGDDTDYSLPGVHPLPGMPNYPGWRVNLGARFTILPKSVYSMTERDILMKKAASRRELFEQIIREQRETEAAEEELDRIKEERRKAERELERLRRILEGEKKRKQQQKDQDKQQEPPPRP